MLVYLCKCYLIGLQEKTLMIQNIGRHDSAVKQASGNQKSTLLEVTNGL